MIIYTIFSKKYLYFLTMNFKMTDLLIHLLKEKIKSLLYFTKILILDFPRSNVSVPNRVMALLYRQKMVKTIKFKTLLNLI